MTRKERKRLYSYVGFIKRRLNSLDEKKKMYESKLLKLTLYLEKTSVVPKRDNKGRFCGNS